MSLSRWLSGFFTSPLGQGRSSRNRPRIRRGLTLQLEALEERSLLSAATHLAFIQQPTTTAVATAIAPAVRVVAEDEFNQVVGSPASVSVNLGNNPTNATLSGITTMGGTFANLSLNTPGNGYTLVATTPSLPLPPLGVSFDGDKTQLEATRFDWAGPASAGLSLQDFTLALAPTVAETGLLLKYQSGGPAIDSVAVHLRDSTVHEYLTYTFHEVTISSYSTGTSSGNTPLVTVSLHFTDVQEQYFRPDGSSNLAGLGPTFAMDAGSLAGPALTTPPAVGLTLDDGSGGALPELALQNYTLPGTSGPSPVVTYNEAGLSLTASAAEPGLWGHLGSPLKSATIRVRDSQGSLLRTYTLQNVIISSFMTTEDSGAIPLDSITLHFTSMTETIAQRDGSTFTVQVGPTVPTITGTLAAPVLAQPPSVGLTLVVKTFLPDGSEQDRTLAELAVQGYGFGATQVSSGAGASISAFQDLALNLGLDGVEPFLLDQAAAGSTLKSATLRVRDNTGLVNLSYSLSNATISQLDLGGNGQGAMDVLVLHATKVEEDSYGSSKVPNTASYDTTTRSGTPGSLAGPVLTTPPSLGLTFNDGSGVPLPELAADSYQFGATNASGSPSLRDFTVNLKSLSAEPGLFGRAALGSVLPSATLRLRDSQGNTYLTYTLQNVTISSFATAEGNGAMPLDSIVLHFTSLTETAVQRDGTAFTVQVGSTVPTTTGTLAAPVLAQPPSIGLTLVVKTSLPGQPEQDTTLPELAVQSYEFGASSSGGSGATLDDVQLSLAPGSLEPFLLDQTVAGSTLKSAILRVRDTTGLVNLSYSLSNATISQLDLGGNGQGAMDVLVLHATKVEEDSYGSSKVPNTASYDITTRSETPGSLAGPMLTTPPSLGLTFNDGSGVPLPEVAALGYSLGGMHTPAAPPILSDFDLVLPSQQSQEAGLLGNLIAGTVLRSVTVHARNAAGLEYLTYLLTNVTISSYVSSNSLVQLNLHFDTLTEFFSPLLPDGTLASPFKNTILLSTLSDPTHQTSVTSAPFTVGNPVAAATTNTVVVNATAIPNPDDKFVTLTAIVTSPSGSVDTGIVVFTVSNSQGILGSIVSAAVHRSNAAASYILPAEWSGTFSIQASYTDPTGTHAASNGTGMLLAKYSTTTQITSTALNDSLFYGQPVSFTATVTPLLGHNMPTGTVQFVVDGSPFGQAVALSATDTVQFTPGKLPAGMHTISAQYSGDGAFLTSTAAAPTLTVRQAVLTVTATDSSRVYGTVNPAFSVSFAGFAPGEGPKVLGGSLAFSTAAGPASVPGVYAVVPSGLTASNYQIQYVPGSLRVVLPGLTHWYRGENNALDSAGTSNGTVNGALSYAQGVAGNAFRFNGIGGNVQLAPLAVGTSDFSVAFFLQTTSAQFQAVLGTRVDPSHGNFFTVRMRADGHLTAELDQDGFATNYVYVLSSRALNDGAFHQVAVVRSGTTLALYLDGVLDGSASSAAPTNLASVNNFLLGAEPPSVGIPSFNGQLDEVQLYSRALSPSDVHVLDSSLAISGTAMPSVVAGGTITYNLTVTNNGPVAVSQLAFSETLPPGTGFLSLTTPAGWLSTTPQVGLAGTITALSGSTSLAPGASANFTVVAQTSILVFGSTTVTTTATISAAHSPGALPGSSSATFSTTVTGFAFGVDIQDQPADTTFGQTISPVRVAVVDQNGATVSSDDRTLVSVAIQSGPAGARLGGTRIVRAVHGWAIFSDLTVSVAGRYVLKVFSGKLTPDLSNEFVVAPVDVTSSLDVQRGTCTPVGLGLYRQMLTITNTSSEALSGPLALRLQDLPGDFVLIAPGGGPSSGSPYVNVLGAGQTLPAGKSVKITLLFDDLARGPVLQGDLGYSIQGLLGV